MSIYTTPLSGLAWADLEELLKLEAVENVRLEFKSQFPARDDILRNLSSFANTYGGYLIVGAMGDSEGRLVGLPGVIPRPNYKQTIVQWCADGATPFLDVDVSDAILGPPDTGRACYAIFTGESELAPHFLNVRMGVYIRTNEFSSRYEARLADETELRHLLDRRRIVRERRDSLIERARERWQTFIRRHYNGPSVEDGDVASRFELAVVPRFPSRPLCDHTRLNHLVADQRVAWRNSLFPYPHDSLISQHESAIAPNPGESFSILEANVWGLCYYATAIQLQGRDRAFTGIHLDHLLGHLLVYLEHSRMFLKEVGYDGSLLIQVRLHGVCGVRWIYFLRGSIPSQGPSSEVDDDVTFDLETTTEVLDRDRDGLASDILRSIFFALNWAEAANSREKLQALIKGGYAFNFWS